MLPTNSIERKQKFKRFSLYYLLSLAAICVVVFAFAGGFGSPATTLPAPAAGPARSTASVLAADSLLHHKFSALESLDNRIGMAMATPKNREAARTADSLRKTLPATEEDFESALDSIALVSRSGSNDALKQTVDFFSSDFALRSNRPSVPRGGAASLPASSAAAAGALSAEELLKSNPELKGEMLKKDIRIADLEATITQLKKTTPVKPDEAKQMADAAAARRLQDDYDALQKNYKTLAETNKNLKNSVAASSDAESDAVKTAKNRVLKMEQQVQALNADISFSTVDCNLSRADVNQIIYNGKQRKVLLQQALDILSSLKKSGDEEIQKRAAQKISQLNKIAMTVRD